MPCYGDGFAGQSGFLNFQGSVLDDTAVSGDSVTGFQNDHVAGNQFIGVQVHHLAVTQHFTGSSSHGLQGFNGGFGLALLEHAQNGVDQNDSQNNDDLCHFVFTGHQSGHRGDRGGDQQDDQHGILQLGQKTLDQGGLLALLQLIGAVLGKTLLRLGRGQSLRAHAEVTKDVFGGLGVGFLHQVFPFQNKKTHALLGKSCMSLILTSYPGC